MDSDLAISRERGSSTGHRSEVTTELVDGCEDEVGRLERELHHDVMAAVVDAGVGAVFGH